MHSVLLFFNQISLVKTSKGSEESSFEPRKMNMISTMFPNNKAHFSPISAVEVENNY